VIKKNKPLDHVPANFRKLVGTSISDYVKVLGIGNYKVKIFYMKKDIHEEDQLSNTLASTYVDMRYLNSHVNIYPCLVRLWQEKKMDDNEVKEVIAHEISHIATHHMYTLATSVYKDEGEMKDAWESLTTTVGRLIHEVDSHRKK
jgi:predicted SprT family Zn-dependent metalloprotease